MRFLYASPIGYLDIRMRENVLTALDLCREEPSSAAQLPDGCELKRWLDAYFAGLDPDPCQIPIAAQGTPFQQLIWSLLRQIPRGQWQSYGELARLAAARLGKPRMSAQAVGNAAGKNPILLLIPCHRVLGADGTLTGFRAGLEIKKALLDLENIPYRETARKP